MNILTALPFAIACVAAASMGTLFPTGAWYESLSKPGWTPPNWLFPIAWTLLYIAIAVAAYRIAGSSHPLVPAALAFWALQICLNAIWTPTVFGAHNLGVGVIIILGLWLSIFATMILNFQIDKVAGWLFVPYLIWVSYASALNIWLWRFNA